MKKKNIKIAVIGQGYVGLPLALEFEKRRKVIGFDTQEKRIKDLQSGIDKNLEVVLTIPVEPGIIEVIRIDSRYAN